MKIVLGTAIALSMALSITAPAQANDFDACVLGHMQGVTSDYAAQSIKRSCITVTEQEIPDPEQIAAQWDASYENNLRSALKVYSAFVITLSNDSGYWISEMTIRVFRSNGAKDYVIRQFFCHPEGAISCSFHDPLDREIVKPGHRKFWFVVPPMTANELKSVQWAVVSLKGWKD